MNAESTSIGGVDETRAPTLRPYQEEALSAIYNCIDAGLRRLMLVLPTGAGKTVVMAAAILGLRRGRCLFVAHREELIHQSARAIRAMGFRVTTCCGGKNDVTGQVVVGTVQSMTQARTAAMQLHGEVPLLIIDEAHHSTAASYMRLIRDLQMDCGRADRVLLGCTATPQRTDRGALGKIYEKIAYRMSIARLIKLGHLSDVQGRAITLPAPSDLVVRTKKGDFAQGDLEELDNKERNKIIVDSFLEHCLGKKAIAFCISVHHAIALADMLCCSGVVARAIYGAMDSDLRAQYLSGFRDGSIQVLTSRDVLTEGYDEPSVECVIMARPTKSSVVYRQAVGRGLRKCSGKDMCHVLDFCYKGHSLSQAYSLDTIMPTATVHRDEPIDADNMPLEAGGKRVGKKKITTRQIGTIIVDMLSTQTYPWVQVQRGVIGTSSKHGSPRICAVFIVCDDPEIIRVQSIAVDPSTDRERHGYTIASDDVFFCMCDAMEAAEGIISDNLNMRYRSKFSMGSNHSLSKSQRALADRLFGDEVAPKLDAGAFSWLMLQREVFGIWREISSPATDAQARFIKNLDSLSDIPRTKSEASRLISTLKSKRYVV